MSSCILTPTIKVGNQEKESKLFKELLSYTGSRESTKQLWCLSQIPEIRDNLNLEYDENGEPTFDSFNKAINIKDYLDGKIGIQGELKEVGAVDSKGETIEYKTSAEAYSKVIEFNNNNPRSVASVVKVPDGYVIQVKKLENSDLNEKKNIVFESRLNNKLLGLLKQLGFDIDVTNDPKYDGIFNPLNAQKNAEGLHTVIQIAKGTRGEEAFPEEFAHVVIAGMRNHPLVQRLLNNLTFDSIEDILGEDYEYYRDEYRADYNKLREEAAGKLLYKYIIKNNENVEHNNLLSRIWNWIKGIFGKAKESEVDNIILESEMEAYELANMVLDGSILPLIDKDLVLDSEPLFKIGKKTNVMKKLAEDALEIASRRLKIVRDRKKNGKYSKEDIKQIKGLQEYIEKKKYALSSIHFLEDSLDQIDGLYKNLKSLKEKYKESASPSLITIKHISSNLREIKTFSDGYSDIIKQMKLLPELLEEGEIDITEEEANKIAGIASQIDNILNVINRNYTSLRFDVVKNFLRIYWGDDKIKKSAGNKTEIITLDMILKMADKDINGLDRWVSSMSDASDPLLSLIDKVVKTSQANRDETINKVLAGIRNATKKLESAGYKSDFMYERDSQGNLTGRLISNIDFERFYKEKEEYMQNLKSQKLKSYQIRAKIEAWERKRMKKIKVVGSTIDRTEIVPIYETNNLSKLSTAQREYYDTMMRYKAMLDDLIPERYANLYNAVQIRNDALESITSNITDPKNAVHSLWGNLKDNFTRRLDDVDYGDLTDGLTEKQRNVVADFNGNPIEKLPVHYIHPLEDMQRLSTDFSGSITAYAGMAINYGEMSKVIDVLELARDLVHDREVKQEIGDSKVVETFKIMGKLFSKAYTKKGSSTNIGNRIDDYYATVIYGKTKKDHGSIRVLDKEVDIAKASDTIKGLTGAVGLGLNAFSAISNLTIGKMQMFIDSVSGSLTNLFGGQAEFFGVSNMAKAEFYYNALLPEYIIEAGSAQKKSKLGLLIDKFDALEEFYNSLRNQGYYNGPMSRIIGKGNIYILNNIGEHSLHANTMLAILDSYKVKDGNKTISLYDALEVINNQGEYSIGLKKGVTNLDGSAFTEKDFIDLKLRIGKINQSLHGAFNDRDKGAIHRHALGRLALQFRQWMPGHYYRRFASEYYDASLDQYREGYYRTLWNFSLNTISDLFHMKFRLATNWSQLTNHQKNNMMRSLTEIAIFALLNLSLALLGDEKDKKGRWGERMLIYNLKRMKLEVGASSPVSFDFVDNIMKILQSPAPALNTIDNILSLFQFQNMFHELESGRYKGWSEYERDLIKIIPIYGQIRKLIDITDEDYMFSIYNS